MKNRFKDLDEHVSWYQFRHSPWRRIEDWYHKRFVSIFLRVFGGQFSFRLLFASWYRSAVILWAIKLHKKYYVWANEVYLLHPDGSSDPVNVIHRGRNHNRKPCPDTYSKEEIEDYLSEERESRQ